MLRFIIEVMPKMATAAAHVAKARSRARSQPGTVSPSTSTVPAMRSVIVAAIRNGNSIIAATAQ